MFRLKMNVVWIILLTGLLIPVRAGGSGREGPPPLAFPPSLGTLTYVDRKTYEQPELGYSVRYAGRKGFKADIYVYDLGMKDLGTGEAGAVVLEHQEMVIHNVFTMQKNGVYRGVQVVEQEELSWATARGVMPLQHALIEYSQVRTENSQETETPVVSHVLLTTFQGHFLKIRFTYSKSERIQGAAALRLFLQDFGELLD